MTTQEEIDQIVAEHNAAEIERTARLDRLFRLVMARKGYRIVRFSGGEMWSNCWQHQIPGKKILPVENMEHQVTEVVAGE